MKIFHSILVIFTISIVPVITFASHGETKRFIFNGEQTQSFLSLNGEKTHTEYRSEQVPRTCYQDVYYGSLQVCRDIPQTRCYTTARSCHQECTYSGNRRMCKNVCRGGERICNTHYERVCTIEPQYRSEPYTCYQTIQTPYEVFDYNTQAEITFNYGQLPEGISPNEEFVVTFDGENISIKVKGSNRLITFQRNKSSETYWSNKTKVLSIIIDLSFGDQKELLKPIAEDIQNIKIDKDTISFEIGKVFNPNNLFTNLKIQERRLLIGKKVIFNRPLTHGQYYLEDRGNKTVVTINLRELGLKRIKNKKYFFTISSQLKFDMAILTEGLNIPNLTLTKKIEKKFNK